MKIEDFERLISIPIVEELIVEYEFLKHWRIDFDHAKKRAGMCQLEGKKISLSRHHISQNSVEMVTDTLLHEYAHAIAFELYQERGHGIVWQKIAQTIGAKPKATGRFNLPDAPWALIHQCPKTKNIKLLAYRYRRNKKITQYFLVGRPETKGELQYLPRDEYEAQLKASML